MDALDMHNPSKQSTLPICVWASHMNLHQNSNSNSNSSQTGGSSHTNGLGQQINLQHHQNLQHQFPHHLQQQQAHQTLPHHLHQHLHYNQHHLHNQGPPALPPQMQSHLQQQQQQQNYNMNSSDYSSSTYHVYDQILGDQIIDDLIIIKQERMKKKLEEEHKRKVILFSLAVILLVGLLMFLILQLFKAISSNTQDKSSLSTANNLPGSTATATATNFSPGYANDRISSISLARIESSFSSKNMPTITNNNNNNYQRENQQSPPHNVALVPPPPLPPFGSTRTQWAPPGGAHSRPAGQWDFAAGQQPPQQVMQQNPQLRNPQFEVQQPEPPNSSQSAVLHQQQFSANGAQRTQQPSLAANQVPPVMLSPPAMNPQQQAPSDQAVPAVQLAPVISQQQQQQSFRPAPAAAEASATSFNKKSGPTPSDISNNHNNNNIRGCHGRHCPSQGCPNQCSNRGQCVRGGAPTQEGPPESSPWHQPTGQLAGQEWRCQCWPNSTGPDCSIPIERQCDDGIDNDRDGLVDCADSECCSDPVCQNSTLCMKSPDPLDILMRKQPPPPTSSFFQRMQFLIEKFSSQIYSNPKDFSDRLNLSTSLGSSSKYVDRASVLRGRVTYQKQGVTGVRVSIAGQINLGITLTRDGGYFDLMVNGGGAVAVEFRREPFATLTKVVRVPWNEIVLVEPIELQLDSQASQDLSSSSSAATRSPLPEPEAPICSAHNYRLLRPQIVAAPSSIKRPSSKPARLQHNNHQHQQVASQQVSSASSSKSPRAIILRDSAMVQQSITLPQSQQASSLGARNESVSLVYISSRANEFMSTINIQLTPNQDQAGSLKLSDELKQIHLKIVIEGILFEQTFEPQLNLSFTYAWNRRNVYRQKSFGLSTASVSVGYEYFDCKQVIWSTKQLQLPGYELAISDIGDSWNLNIHHRYNYRESILQRGDGSNFNLKVERPRIVLPVMGDGYQRQAVCPFCDGATSPAEQKLLKPVALVSAPDGSLYVGDSNLIRRIEPPLATTSGSASSAAAASQAERSVRTVLELPTNRVPEEGYALALNLAPPTGGATETSGSPTTTAGPRLYMTDTDRRQVFLVREQRSSSSTGAASLERDPTNETTPPSGGQQQAAAWDEALVAVAGNGQRCSAEDALSCGDGQQALSARLIEPRALAFDLAGRMYLADGPNVRLVDVDGRIYTILGNYAPGRQATKFPCAPGEALPMHKFVPKRPLDLALNPIDETLHLLDDNTVYKITQDKRVQVVAGRPTHCAAPALEQGGKSHHQQARATEVHLRWARSIAFNQNGQLFIGEDDPKANSARVLLVSPEDDTISLHAGLPSVELAGGELQSESVQSEGSAGAKHRLSNLLLPLGPPASQAMAARATEFKFHSISALALDQRGHLIVADKAQLRVVSIEPDLPQITQAGEYEIQSPENPDELLVFNRHGHHVATRELSSGASLASAHLFGAAQQVATSGGQQRSATTNKYTFAYNVNTSFGQLASVSLANGNKISIYRDGPHHSVKMIETAFGGQCKLDISRNGQVHSIATMGPPSTTKTSMLYHIGGGLLKQSRDSTSGEVYDFLYDEFGRALAIQHSSPRLPAPVECRLQAQQLVVPGGGPNAYLSQQQCNSLIVAE